MGGGRSGGVRGGLGGRRRTFLARYSGVFGRPGARPDGKTAPTTASASRTSPVDGGRFRVVPKGRADRPLNLANAVRTSACGTKDDDGWPGKRGVLGNYKADT